MRRSSASIERRSASCSRAGVSTPEEPVAVQHRDPARVVLQHRGERLPQRRPHRQPRLHAARVLAQRRVTGRLGDRRGRHPAVQRAGVVQHHRPAGVVRRHPLRGPLQPVLQPDHRRLFQVALLDRCDGQPLQTAVRADEVGDVRGGRRAQHLRRRVELLDAALPVDRHPVPEPHRLLDVVRDEQHRLAHLLLQLQELVLQVLAHHRVDRAERLVHQQHRRVRRQRPRHAHPLPLPAGELVRVAVAVAGGVQADQVEQFGRPRLPLRARPAQQGRHGRGVLQHRLVREEAHLLDDVADPAPQPHRFDVRDVLAVQQDPPGRRLDQPVHHLHRGGLAAPGRADERDQLALSHLERQVVHGDGPVGVALADMFETNHETHSDRHG